MEKGAISTVSVTDNIALISADNLNNNSYLIHKIFDEISRQKINIDMITLAHPYKNFVDFSFVIDESNVLKCIEAIGKFKALTCAVNSGNSKISIVGSSHSDWAMTTLAILDMIFDSGADIKLITASGGQMSVLVDDTHADLVYKMLLQYIK